MASQSKIQQPPRVCVTLLGGAAKTLNSYPQRKRILLVCVSVWMSFSFLFFFSFALFCHFFYWPWLLWLEILTLSDSVVWLWIQWVYLNINYLFCFVLFYFLLPPLYIYKGHGVVKELIVLCRMEKVRFLLCILPTKWNMLYFFIFFIFCGFFQGIHSSSTNIICWSGLMMCFKSCHKN